MEENNKFRWVRKRLGLSQQAIATKLEMSLGSVRAYESGTRLSEWAEAKLKALCASTGIPYPFGEDELAERPFAVTRVFDRPTAVRLPPPGEGSDLGDEMHKIVDLLVSSGRGDLLAIVEGVLTLARNELLRGKEVL